MDRAWIVFVVLLLFGLQPLPAQADPAPLTDLTALFPSAFDATATLPPAQRIGAVKDRLRTGFAAFYAARGRSEAAFDAQLARSLESFPSIRSSYARTSREFEHAFSIGQSSFRAAFPDYALSVPVYLLHSLGEMDGGTRTLDGRTVAVFGADVIAALHDEKTLKPFLDHELFHFYHHPFFHDCEPLWCDLWSEGLAVLVAARLNPDASDEQLALTRPRPIRAEIEPHLAEAMCVLRSKFDSTAPDDSHRFFRGDSSAGNLPPRSGYFLGYLLATKIAARVPLEALARLPSEQVRPLLMQAVASFGDCPAK